MTDQAILQTALTSLALDKLGGRSQRSARLSRSQAVRTAREVWRSRQAAKSNAPTDRLEERAYLRDQIAEMQRGGMLAVQIMEIDGTGSSAVLIPATVMAYVQLERAIYSDPDAWVAVTPISEEDARYFHPQLQFNNNQ